MVRRPVLRHRYPSCPALIETRRIDTSGLVKGGGALTVDRQLTVDAASVAEVAAGTRNDAAVTPAAIAPALAAKADLTALSGKASIGRKSVSDVNYAALASDAYIAATSLTASQTITLPAASSFPPGQPLYIADKTGLLSNTLVLTIQRAGSDTIAGQTSVDMMSPYQKLVLHSNGSNLWTY